jgi:hypothetical protein
MAARSDVHNTNISPDLDQQQQAGFLLLAVVSASEAASSGVDGIYRLELVDKRKRAVLKGPSGCALSCTARQQLQPALCALMVSTDCDATCRHTLVDRSEGAHTDGKGCTLLQAVGRQVGLRAQSSKPLTNRMTSKVLQLVSTSGQRAALETPRSTRLQVATNGVEASATVLQQRASGLLVRLDVSFPLRCIPWAHCTIDPC